MKTPMQELLYALKVDRANSQSDSAIAYIDVLIEYIETDLVPYEKFVMNETWDSATDDLEEFKTFEEYYNATFKTKEK